MEFLLIWQVEPSWIIAGWAKDLVQTDLQLRWSRTVRTGSRKQAVTLRGRRSAGACIYGVLTAASEATQAEALITRKSQGSRVESSDSSKTVESFHWTATIKTVSKKAMEYLKAWNKRQVSLPIIWVRGRRGRQHVIWRKAHASDLHKVKNNLAMTVMLEHIYWVDWWRGAAERLANLKIQSLKEIWILGGR